MNLAKMPNSNILLHLLIIVFFKPACQAKRPYSIEVLDFQVRTLNPHIDAMTLSSSFDKKHVNVAFSFAENVTVFSAKFELSTLAEGRPPTTRLKLDVDICKCLRSSCRAGFVSALLKEVFRAANFADGCPLLANKLYFLKNYTIREDDYPMLLPKIMWKVSINTIFNRKPTMAWVAKGRVY